MTVLAARKPTKQASRVKPLVILPWLLYAAVMIWFPIHESVVARENVAAGDFARCRQHAASTQALRFCESDYQRDLLDAREIHWDHHPLWHPFWLAPLVLLLPPFGIFGLIWILTRGANQS